MFEHECKYFVLYRSWNSSGKAWVGTPVGSHRYQNTIKIGTKYFPIGHAHILKVKSLKVQPDGVKGRKVCGTIYGDIHYKRLRLRTPISTKQTQLCTRSNLKVIRQQRTTVDYYASRR